MRAHAAHAGARNASVTRGFDYASRILSDLRKRALTAHGARSRPSARNEGVGAMRFAYCALRAHAVPSTMTKLPTALFSRSEITL